jgi:hypothetical protein
VQAIQIDEEVIKSFPKAGKEEETNSGGRDQKEETAGEGEMKEYD